MLEKLPVGEHKAVFSLTDDELTKANRWNQRISACLQHFNAPYSKCMKRALVMAMMLGNRHNLKLVIGMQPNEPTVGHAWLELCGEIVAEKYDAVATTYVPIKYLAVVFKED